MNRRVLFVDDDVEILQSFQRQLRGHCEVATAPSGMAGLELIRTNGPFAVVISDFRMPAMDGILFLSAVKELSPESARILLTGHADLHVAIEAVNEGNIFRLLLKPCAEEVLVKALEAGIEHYHLVMTEKELVEKTLVGSVRTLTDVLGAVSPMAISRALRIRPIVASIVGELKLENAWQYELAASLSQIGMIALPPDLLYKLNEQKPLSRSEIRVYEKYPEIGYELLRKIPRLELIAEMIRGQESSLEELKPLEKAGDQRTAALGAHILRVALDYDKLATGGMHHKDIMELMFSRKGLYLPEVLNALNKTHKDLEADQIALVNLQDLDVGMVLLEDIWNRAGVLIAAKGLEITYPILMQLFKLSQGSRISSVEPIKVYVPK